MSEESRNDRTRRLAAILESICGPSPSSVRGVSEFTDDELDAIHALHEAGDIAGAQRAIYRAMYPGDSLHATAQPCP
jgi:hypothetical protein